MKRTEGKIISALLFHGDYAVTTKREAQAAVGIIDSTANVYLVGSDSGDCSEGFKLIVAKDVDELKKNWDSSFIAKQKMMDWHGVAK